MRQPATTGRVAEQVWRRRWRELGHGFDGGGLGIHLGVNGRLLALHLADKIAHVLNEALSPRGDAPP